MPNEQTSVPLFTSGEVLTAANMNLSAGTGTPVFLNSTTRDAGFGGANEKVLAEGQLCYLSSTNVVQYYDGAAWATVGPGTALAFATFNETQASGTNGGTFTSGSMVKRTLNTTVVNTITSCTLTSSVISLPAGTYQVLANAPANTVNAHKTRLRDTTAASTLATGQTSYNSTTVTTPSFLFAYFTLSTTSNIELQHQCETTKASDGLGTASAFSGISEIYSQIQIMKVA